MQMTTFKLKLSLIVCIVLIAAMALLATGCNGNKDTSGSSAPDITVSETQSNALGTGATNFTFTVTDAEGKETTYQINTNKKTVGDALVELKLIAGDESEYGLYVKTVNGITLSEKDRMFWALYMNGKQLQTGVSSAEITAGAKYSFKAEKY